MASKKSPTVLKKSPTISYGEQLQQVVGELKSHFRYNRGKTARLVRDIHRFGTDSGVLTRRQLQVLGFIYKRHINNDKYVHHDWAIWH